MTTQAAMIMDTVLGMQRTIAQHNDSSDTDNPYLRPSNRGNKLKRKARAPASESALRKRSRTSYTTSIDYNGYNRDILRRNPKRYDEDGDEIGSEDEDEEADARAAEDNPYTNIRLEKLLCPLTSAALLPQHPSLSVPYLSATLSDMAQQASEDVQRERKTLEIAKLLLLKLRGDELWLPTGRLNAPIDNEIFSTAGIFEKIVSRTLRTDADESLTSGENRGRQNGSSKPQDAGRAGAGTDKSRSLPRSSQMAPETSTPFGDPSASHDPTVASVNGKLGTAVNGAESGPIINGEAGLDGAVADTADGVVLKTASDAHEDLPMDDPAADGNSASDLKATLKIASTSGSAVDPASNEADSAGGDMELAENGEDEQPPPRRMRTRAQAQEKADPVASPHSASVELSDAPPPVHPLFLSPASAKVDADFGLPALEAEETRRMLMIYVQKQEEICRSAEQLYESLLKADRQRTTVFKWCKAEGHIGELSDGEDWYDKEEWGLDADLRKGEADDRGIDDDVGTQSKKTRGRRA